MDVIWLCILALVVLIFLTIAGIALYSGLFTSFTVGAGPPPVKSLVLVYKFGRGPYSQCVDVFNESCSIAPDKRSIGFYYDDPKQVPAERLRWAVGSIIAEGADFPDTDVIGKFLDKGYKLFHTPQISSVVKAQFPYTTPFSIFIAIFRVYPVMGDYVKSKQLCAHPYMEIYDGNIIHFIAPLARQDDFYVPEVLEDEEGTPERETSVEPPEEEERGQGDAKVQGPKKEKALLEDDQVQMTTSAQNEMPEKKPEKEPERTSTEESAPLVPSDELKLPESDKERRSVSTSSFLTATSEVTKDEGEEKEVRDEAVERIKVKLNKSTPEGVQDSGISSTSRGSNTPTPVATKLDAMDSTDAWSSQQDSSSNIGSSATSLDSVSSLNSSSVTSHSEAYSYTSHSFTSGSSINEDSAGDLSCDQSTEVSCDLNEVSGDSDGDLENSQERVNLE